VAHDPTDDVVAIVYIIIVITSATALVSANEGEVVSIIFKHAIVLVVLHISVTRGPALDNGVVNQNPPPSRMQALCFHAAYELHEGDVVMSRSRIQVANWLPL
jgi:hypothetical protein